MSKIRSALSTAASYITPRNIINATRCSGQIVNVAGKAVEYGGKTIRNLSQEGKKLLESYIKYLNQKNPDGIKENEEFGQGMESLLNLIAGSAEFAEHVGHDIASMGNNVAHLADPINPEANEKITDGQKPNLIEGTA
jgi:hypothetical protein